MSTVPGGDAMTVRYHRNGEAEVPEHQARPRPVAWSIHPADAAEFAADGLHCETRRCRNPQAVVTWRWWRSAEVGEVLLTEHLVCLEHGQQFAARHHAEVEPPPPRPCSSRHGRSR